MENYTQQLILDEHSATNNEEPCIQEFLVISKYSLHILEKWFLGFHSDMFSKMESSNDQL